MAKMSTAKDPKECCSCRDVLWYLVFIGFAVNYMIRINLNIAIVSMVNARPKNLTTAASECLATNPTTPSNSSAPILFHVPHRFDWNEREQSSILGAFFWLHWLTQIPGGILASRYGTKAVFGWSNFSGVLCCFLIPWSAVAGKYHLIGLRVFQGVLCGFSWPAMHNMTARWIPPNDRGKFVTAYLGSSIGAALTYPVCGFIIQRWGWELTFYTSGIVGTLWFVAWSFLVYDSPAKHPRISDQEKQYILEHIGESYTKKKAPVPWLSICTSLPVWMNILAQWGGIWGLFTLMTHTPTYFRFIHGWSIQATGILSGLGHVLRTTWSYISGRVGDYLLRTNRMSRTNVRKLATTGCTIGQGAFMLALAYSGCNYTWAVVFLSASVAMNGSVSTGPLASIVDISPNYASIILGVVNTVVAMVGFITPTVVGFLTYQNQSVAQWQKVFWIASVMLFVSGSLYVVFQKSELEPWNSPHYDSNNSNKGTELLTIKSTGGDDEEQEKLNTP